LSGMSVAPDRGMKTLMKMLGVGALMVAAIAYDRWRLRRAGRLDAFPREPEVVTETVIVGIAEVDPASLANVAGEMP
jgi:hypothetical protein